MPYDCKSCTFVNNDVSPKCVACGGTERGRVAGSKNPLPTVQLDENGLIRETKVVNQWSPSFYPLVHQYRTHAEISPFLSCAIALIAQERFPLKMTSAQVDDMVTFLRDEQTLMPVVKEVISFVHRDREHYIQSHPGKFRSQRDIDTFFANWPSNYEISDWLRSVGNKGIHFVRRLDRVKTHDETTRRRVAEEERPFCDYDFFMDHAATASSSSSSPASSAAAEAKQAKVAASSSRRTRTSSSKKDLEDSLSESTSEHLRRVSMASHSAAATERVPPNVLSNTEAWINQNLPIASSEYPSTNPVFIADLAGHMVVLKPILLQSTDASATSSDSSSSSTTTPMTTTTPTPTTTTRMLFVLNTSASCNAFNPLVKKVFHMFFDRVPEASKMPIVAASPTALAEVPEVDAATESKSSSRSSSSSSAEEGTAVATTEEAAALVGDESPTVKVVAVAAEVAAAAPAAVAAVAVEGEQPLVVLEDSKADAEEGAQA